jgi:hypothetical protein
MEAYHIMCAEKDLVKLQELRVNLLKLLCVGHESDGEIA